MLFWHKLISSIRCEGERQDLVFTGLMGSGKTTIGRLVADGLNRQFIDTDQYLQEKYGSAKQILEKPNGDAEFAAIEEDIAPEDVAAELIKRFR